MTWEMYKDSRSRSYVPSLPFSFFVLVQKDDGVVVAPPPGGAGVCGGRDREWMYESVGYNVCLLVLSAAEHSPPGQKLRLGGVALGADPTYLGLVQCAIDASAFERDPGVPAAQPLLVGWVKPGLYQ